MLKKYYTILIVLYPILSAYSIVGPIDLGVALCGFVAGLMYLSGSGKLIEWPKGWKAFLIYVLVVAIIVTHSIPARIILYTFLLVIGCGVCNLKSIHRYYKLIAKVCIVFFIFQEIIRITIGINVPGIFTFLPTVYGDSASFIASNILGSKRSASFFLEPSYFAQFLFPLIVLELFWNKDNKHMRNAILLSFITLLIRSGNGLVLLAIIWLTWIFTSDINKKTKRYVILAGGLVIMMLFVINPSMLLDVLNRSNELSVSEVDNQWHSSGFIRFWRGYFLYALFPSVNKLFGMSPTMIRYYMENKSLGLFDQDINAAFINGIQTILCFYGLFGLIFVLRHLYLIGKKSTFTVKVLLICILYLLLSESYFICSRMLLVMILAYLLKHTFIKDSTI